MQHIYIYIFICACVYECIYVCMFVWMYVLSYITCPPGHSHNSFMAYFIYIYLDI